MPAKPDVLQHLAERIRQMETAATACSQGAFIQLPLLATLFGRGELRAGSLIELQAVAEGAGAWSLALFLARQACHEQATLVLVDPRHWFYPPAAAALGIDLENVLLIRPTRRADCHGALEQALRCRGVGAVIGWAERLRPAEARRLLLASEAGGRLGLLLRPPDERGDCRIGDPRLRVAPLAGAGTARRIRIEVMHWRGGGEGRTGIVEIDDETGHVRVSAGLAPSETGTRTARPAS
jgi:hypothetical protein